MAKNPNSPLYRIRKYCLRCAGNYHMVNGCLEDTCPLYDFRFGKNPFLKTRLTEEQRAEAAERLRRAREMRE